MKSTQHLQLLRGRADGDLAVPLQFRPVRFPHGEVNVDRPRIASGLASTPVQLKRVALRDGVPLRVGPDKGRSAS